MEIQKQNRRQDDQTEHRVHGQRVNPVLKALELHGIGCGNGQNAAHFTLHIGAAAGCWDLGVAAQRGWGGCSWAAQRAFQLRKQLGMPVALHGNRFNHRAAQLASQFVAVNDQPASPRHIRHVQGHRYR